MIFNPHQWYVIEDTHKKIRDTEAVLHLNIIVTGFKCIISTSIATEANVELKLWSV